MGAQLDRLCHGVDFALSGLAEDELVADEDRLAEKLGKPLVDPLRQVGAESAERELAEELGVEGVKLTPCFNNYFEDTANKVWGRVFRCKHEGPFDLQKEEIESGGFMNVTQILDAADSQLFTPDGIEILRRLSG